MNVNALRAEIPAIVNDPDRIYFDNAATAFKPQCVIEAVRAYDEQYPYNIGRGDYVGARYVSALYEAARQTIADVFGVASRQVIFTSGATDAVNLLAASFPYTDNRYAEDGDFASIIAETEHHSNWLPWSEHSFAKPYILKSRPDGTLRIEDLFDEGVCKKPLDFVAVTAMSNVTGYKPDLKRIDELTPNKIVMCVDATQAVAHDPHRRFADYHGNAIVLSSHKLGGPTGVGALIVSEWLLEAMTPSRFGGGMVRHVSRNDVEYGEPPHVFEAGTPPIAQAIGFAEALRYRSGIMTAQAEDHMLTISNLLSEGLGAMGKVGVFGDESYSADSPIKSFLVRGISVAEVGRRLDERGISVRVGNHCAQPYLRAMRAEHSVRVSLQYYNTEEEVDLFLQILGEIIG